MPPKPNVMATVDTEKLWELVKQIAPRAVDGRHNLVTLELSPERVDLTHVDTSTGYPPVTITSGPVGLGTNKKPSGRAVICVEQSEILAWLEVHRWGPATTVQERKDRTGKQLLVLTLMTSSRDQLKITAAGEERANRYRTPVGKSTREPGGSVTTSIYPLAAAFEALTRFAQGTNAAIKIKTAADLKTRPQGPKDIEIGVYSHKKAAGIRVQTLANQLTKPFRAPQAAAKALARLGGNVRGSTRVTTRPGSIETGDASAPNWTRIHWDPTTTGEKVKLDQKLPKSRPDPKKVSRTLQTEDLRRFADCARRWVIRTDASVKLHGVTLDFDKHRLEALTGKLSARMPYLAKKKPERARIDPISLSISDLRTAIEVATYGSALAVEVIVEPTNNVITFRTPTSWSQFLSN